MDENEYHKATQHWLAGIEAIRKAREAKGWTIVEASKQTRFPVEMVRLIEDGMMDEVPIDVFVVYVRALGGRVDYGYTLDGVRYPFAVEE